MFFFYLRHLKGFMFICYITYCWIFFKSRFQCYNFKEASPIFNSTIILYIALQICPLGSLLLFLMQILIFSRVGIKKMIQYLGIYVTIAEDTVSALTTHTGVTITRGSTIIFWQPMNIWRQNNHIHKILLYKQFKTQGDIINIIDCVD